MRLIAVTTLLALATGCGLGGASLSASCDKYLDAAEKCLEEAGEDPRAVDEGVCADFAGEDDYFKCLSAAYTEGDCSTAEGLQAVLNATAECEVYR